MKPIFLKYFTQSDTTRAKAGFEAIDGVQKNEAERLRDILTSKSVLGGSQKGYFRYQGNPETVSFTGARLEELDSFFERRSKFGFAVLRARLPGARAVIYMNKGSIQRGEFNPENKWLIDRADTLEELSETDEFLEVERYYDYSWQDEWRLRASKLKFERLDFVFAPGKSNCKRIIEVYGQEAYDTNEHISRVKSYRNQYCGDNPPLEEFLGRKFTEKLEQIKEARPKEGVLVLPEIVELAWDEIRKSRR